MNNSRDPNFNIHSLHPSALLSRWEAEQYFGLNRGTLRNWDAAGRGPRATRVGRAVRYQLRDLVAFIDSLTEAPKP